MTSTLLLSDKRLPFFFRSTFVLNILRVTRQWHAKGINQGVDGDLDDYMGHSILRDGPASFLEGPSV